MKRLIAVLLVMGVIMTVFAETATGTAGRMYISSEAEAAKTDVVLNLTQNAGIVWFSAGENQNVNTYILTLPEITVLNQSTYGNDNWVAKGTDLKLNWNIVSCNNVKIDLIIGGKLTGTNPNNTIGWKVSFKETAYTGNTPTPAQTSTTLCAGYPGSSNKLSATAVTKDKSIYGSSGSLLIEEIVTENTYGKNVDNYKATLTAMISTTN